MAAPLGFAPSPRQCIQGAHDGGPVEVLRGIVQHFREGVMQRADRLGGVARAPSGQVKPVPLIDQHPQGEPVPDALCPLGRGCVLALGRRVPARRHVAHDGRGSLASLRKGECRTGAQGDAPFLAVQRVLAEIVPAAARRDPDGKPALPIVKDKAVLPASPDFERFDLALRQLHRPALPFGPHGSADP